MNYTNGVCIDAAACMRVSTVSEKQKKKEKKKESANENGHCLARATERVKG